MNKFLLILIAGCIIHGLQAMWMPGIEHVLMIVVDVMVVGILSGIVYITSETWKDRPKKPRPNPDLHLQFPPPEKAE